MSEVCPLCERDAVLVEEYDAMPVGTPYDDTRCWASVLGYGRAECRRINRARDANLLDLAKQLPPGVLGEVVRVLRHGAKKYGCEPHESGGEQLAGDHVRHAQEHCARTFPMRDSRDDATGALDLVHAICRLWLAASLVTEGNR